MNKVLILSVFVVCLLVVAVWWCKLPDLDAFFHDINRVDVINYSVFCLFLGGLVGMLLGGFAMFCLMQPETIDVTELEKE